MTDKPFQSGSLLLVDKNISKVAHFNKRFKKNPHFIPVSPSGQKLWHYKILNLLRFCFKNVKVGI